MDILDVPEVTYLPELSGNVEDPVSFADMVLTAALRWDSALLYAEHPWRENDGSISWRIQPRDRTIVSREVEIGISPSLGSFRSVLARFGHHYMADQLYNGYALRWLRQHSITRRCQIYMSNTGLSGYWIRVYLSSY